ncbi:hypothetical protein QFZ22_009612 [Streptomyces canus]|uniref:Uncharacterized protein n=1 Tax=Streptomyces canus TaxID=58343 RepID=A0AAW8FX46_9ACTN|nr:hypothetical protein [Streptomyces canus]MDQ0913540.1 hypothetical protein [Streptomyces canus]
MLVEENVDLAGQADPAVVDENEVVAGVRQLGHQMGGHEHGRHVRTRLDA